MTGFSFTVGGVPADDALILSAAEVAAIVERQRAGQFSSAESHALAATALAALAAVDRVRSYCGDALELFLRNGIDSTPAVGVADVLSMLGDTNG